MMVDNILIERIDGKKQKRAEFTKKCIDPIYSIGTKYDLRFIFRIIDGSSYNELHWEFINWITKHNEDFFYDLTKKKKQPNENLKILREIHFHNGNTLLSFNNYGPSSSLECYPERWKQLKEILTIIKKSLPEYLNLKTKEYNLKLQEDLKKYDEDEIICNYCFSENPDNAIFCCFCGTKINIKEDL